MVKIICTNWLNDYVFSKSYTKSILIKANL